MLERIKQIYNEAFEKINNVNNIEDLNNFRNSYLSKKSELMSFMSKMKEFSGEEKAKFGQTINEVKNKILSLIETRKTELEEKMLNEKLASEVIDITLPSVNMKRGSKHLFNSIVDEVSQIFIGMGYKIAEGPEVETDEFNFELLNVPKGHPARDMQDTFFIDDTRLMRSQTSPVQAHVMLQAKGVGPIKIISPGKVYRRDDDATHSHQFMQIEGLLVDKNISLSDLKGTIDVLVKKLFGPETETRFHPSYYQFTEPSVEGDISCFNCHGAGCHICKNTGWITVVGAGVVHPNVLKMSGYDPKKWSGFAFGFGSERLAMLKYGINDCRVFYNTDLREEKVFDRKENDLND